MIHIKVWVARSTVLLTINTMHHCIKRRRPIRVPDLRISLAQIETVIARGSYSLVTLIGMSRSPIIRKVGGVELLIVVPVAVIVGLVADQTPPRVL